MLARAPALEKPRLPKTEKEYALQRKALERRNLSLQDLIFAQYKKGKAVLVPNPFPYHVSDAKVTHLVYWIHPNDRRQNKTLLHEALNLAKKQSKAGNDEIVVFQNRKKDQSIPQIKHIHVFIKSA